MKKTLTLLLCLTLLLSLCACGANSEMATDNGYYDYKNESSTSAGIGFDGLWAGGSAAPQDKPMEPSTEAASGAPDSAGSTFGPSSSLPENVKMIYRGYLELESTAFDTAITGLSELVTKMGGYFETSELNNYDKNYRRAYYVVRVPADQYNAFCTAVGGLAQLNSQRHTTENVSEAYYDTEARLQTQRTKMERLQELLAKAENMEDIITLESSIAETELQIEYLTGSLRKYDALVDYATVTIDLQEVYVLSEQEQPVIGFFPKLIQAFGTGTARFVDDIQDFALDFARNWVGSLIWLAVLALVIVLIVRRMRNKDRKPLFRRKKKAAAAPAAPADKPEEQ